MKATTILLMVEVWFGPGRLATARQRDAIESRTEFEAYATEMPLVAAIQKLKEYERRYAEKYAGLAVEFKLLSVSELQPVGGLREALEKLKVTWCDEAFGSHLDE